MNSVTRKMAITMAITIVSAFGTARANDTASLRIESRYLEHNAAVTDGNHASSRISQDFARFAGSSVNAGNLVRGLRRGTPIMLTPGSGAGGQPTFPVSFTPPTGPLGNASVYISLALAEQRLASLGITQPTPEQIKAALAGGTVTAVTAGSGAAARTVNLPGVLKQRGQGMGWGNIAKAHGVKLGAVVIAMKSANHDLAAIHSHQVGTANAVETSSGW